MRSGGLLSRAGVRGLAMSRMVSRRTGEGLPRFAEGWCRFKEV